MTFREWAVQYIYERGVFEADAKTIVEACIADEANKAMDRWDDDIEGYPVSMRAVLVLALNRATVTWIEANKPLAWFKPMFDGTPLPA